MERLYLRILLAIALSLMCVLLSSGYDGRNGLKRRTVHAEKNAEKAAPGRTFKIKYGQEVTLKGESLKVKFDPVVEDSRCPADVKCIWAGDAKIVISVRRANANESKVELHTNGQFKQTGKYQQYLIKLLALDPYPRSSAEVKPSNYVATLLITKE